MGLWRPTNNTLTARQQHCHRRLPHSLCHLRGGGEEAEEEEEEEQWEVEEE